MSNQRWSLKGKKALITGASRGIGRAIAEEFLQLGAEIFIVGRNETHLNQALHEWQAKGFSAHGTCADLAQGRVAAESAIHSMQTKWDTLDILINNAGTNVRKPTVDYTEEEFATVMQTNLNAVFYLCQFAYPFLCRSGQSSIVNIASVSGLTDTSSGSIYGMSKAAVIQLGRNLAVEWAKDNIRVNTIAPGYVATDLTRPILSDATRLQDILARTPQRRVGTPQDISGMVAFLCMPTADYLTGQCLTIDGGLTITSVAKHTSSGF